MFVYFVNKSIINFILNIVETKSVVLNENEQMDTDVFDLQKIKLRGRLFMFDILLFNFSN